MKGKPGLMIALGLGKPKSKDKEESKGSSSGSTEAAQALLDAIKKDSAKAVASAFSDLMACCDEEAYGEEDDE